MYRIAFGFDLHNTIMDSNDTWIEAYLMQSDEKYRNQITYAVYQKQPRQQIAEKLGIDYDSVYRNYCNLIRPSREMLQFLEVLKSSFPTYLISAASKRRVRDDLEKWKGETFFDLILTQETFCKKDPQDWLNLKKTQEIDLLVYVGNDVEEDVPIVPGIIPLICGSFLEKLNGLNLLIKRMELLK